MKKAAQQIAKKYSVDYKELIGRGKSYEVQAARRELIYELLSGGNDADDIAKFLSNRSVHTVRWIYESFKGRDDKKRLKPGPRIFRKVR